MPEVPNKDALKTGLIDATAMFIGEADLAHAVGESGVVHVTLRVNLDRGKVRQIHGSVYFDRRIDFR